MILVETGTELLLSCKINQRWDEMKRRLKLSSFLFGTIIARAYDEGGRSIWLPGRSQTFINIFSLSACQACTYIEQAPPLSNFKRAAKAAPAAASFVGCQILKAAAILCAAAAKAAPPLSNFKSSCDLTMERQLHRNIQRSCEFDSCKNLTARITFIYQP